jgi:hypothetical protein
VVFFNIHLTEGCVLTVIKNLITRGNVKTERKQYPVGSSIRTYDFTSVLIIGDAFLGPIDIDYLSVVANNLRHFTILVTKYIFFLVHS